MNLPKFTAITASLFLPTLSAFSYDTPDTEHKTIHTDNSAADIQAAFDYVKARGQAGWVVTSGRPGDTINLTTPITIAIPAGDVIWQGASPSNRTSITYAGKSGFGIMIGGGINKEVCLKNFYFHDWNTANAFILIGDAGWKLHMTNCVAVGRKPGQFLGWFSAPGTPSGARVAGPFGLIDHCDFTAAAFEIRQADDSPDQDWRDGHAIQWGTKDFVFFEDNVIHDSGITDAMQAGKYVFRHNTVYVENNDVSGSIVGSHGRDSTYKYGGGPGGHPALGSVLQIDAYSNNFITRNGHSVNWLILVRGGHVRAHDNAYAPQSGVGAGVGVEFQAHCLASSNIGAGEFCRDWQTGKVLTSIITYPDQQRARGYVWNNSNNASTFQYGSWTGVQDGDFTRLGRDYFDHAPPAEDNYSTFQYPHPRNTGGAPAPPSIVVIPEISGIARVGQTLSVTTGQWNAYPYPPTFSVQWVACDDTGSNCSNIEGATAWTYFTDTACGNHKLGAAITAHNSEGETTAKTGLTAVVTLPGQDNLLVNGSFEDGNHQSIDNNNNDPTWDGWVVQKAYGYMRNSVDAVDGTYSWKVVRGWTKHGEFPGGNDMYIEQTVAVQPKKLYHLRFKEKHDYNEPARYTITDETHGGTPIVPRSYATAGARSTWATTANDFTTPEGCTAIKLRIDVIDLGGAESSWVDQVVLYPEPEPTPVPAVKPTPAPSPQPTAH